MSQQSQENKVQVVCQRIKNLKFNEYYLSHWNTMNLWNFFDTYMAQQSFWLASHGSPNMPNCKVFTTTRGAFQTVIWLPYCQVSKQRLDFYPIGRHLLLKFVGHFVPNGKRNFSNVVALVALSMPDPSSVFGQIVAACTCQKMWVFILRFHCTVTLTDKIAIVKSLIAKEHDFSLFRHLYSLCTKATQQSWPASVSGLTSSPTILTSHPMGFLADCCFVFLGKQFEHKLKSKNYQCISKLNNQVR